MKYTNILMLLVASAYAAPIDSTLSQLQPDNTGMSPSAKPQDPDAGLGGLSGAAGGFDVVGDLKKALGSVHPRNPDLVTDLEKDLSQDLGIGVGNGVFKKRTPDVVKDLEKDLGLGGGGSNPFGAGAFRKRNPDDGDILGGLASSATGILAAAAGAGSVGGL